MSETRVPCPDCGQDWLQRILLVHLERDAVFCPECEALWLPGEEIAVSTRRGYWTYMTEHGRTEPHAQGEFLVRGPLTNEG